ncbi:hypothetical protein [Kibdelosporangium aridum]|uniref:Uncharacterized protein n=1 Tax=Kibdelosporangium aridum TaxID=2030 RepID=A0A1W2EY76_KIBAR|nr:hypothetical protein [Kibdelosporangium aridum]SMD14158.1 hypothetical protein SAMN05661093_04980 [Kibdelosporangium aridum]
MVATVKVTARFDTPRTCQHAHGVHCGRCIDTDPEYRAHVAHGGPTRDACPYCPDSADIEPAASPVDPFDPLGVLNGSHVSNCPVLTDPDPVPDDCICVG